MLKVLRDLAVARNPPTHSHSTSSAASNTGTRKKKAGITVKPTSSGTEQELGDEDPKKKKKKTAVQHQHEQPRGENSATTHGSRKPLSTSLGGMLRKNDLISTSLAKAFISRGGDDSKENATPAGGPTRGTASSTPAKLPPTTTHKKKKRKGTSSVSSHSYDCPICMELLYHPTTTSCGHTFCLHCLVILGSCPLCRHELNPALDFFEDETYNLRMQIHIHPRTLVLRKQQFEKRRGLRSAQDLLRVRQEDYPNPGTSMPSSELYETEGAYTADVHPGFQLMYQDEAGFMRRRAPSLVTLGRDTNAGQGAHRPYTVHSVSTVSSGETGGTPRLGSVLPPQGQGGPHNVHHSDLNTNDRGRNREHRAPLVELPSVSHHLPTSSRTRSQPSLAPSPATHQFDHDEEGSGMMEYGMDLMEYFLLSPRQQQQQQSLGTHLADTHLGRTAPSSAVAQTGAYGAAKGTGTSDRARGNSDDDDDDWVNMRHRQKVNASATSITSVARTTGTGSDSVAEDSRSTAPRRGSKRKPPMSNPRRQTVRVY